MLDDKAAKPLLDGGWKRDGEALAWQGKHGTTMRFDAGDRRAELLVFFDGAQVLGYELRIDRDRLPELATALATETAALDRMQHGGFSKAVATLARDVVVTTTEGQKVKPRLEGDQLLWDSLPD